MIYKILGLVMMTPFMIGVLTMLTLGNRCDYFENLAAMYVVEMFLIGVYFLFK